MSELVDFTLSELREAVKETICDRYETAEDSAFRPLCPIDSRLLRTAIEEYSLERHSGEVFEVESRFHEAFWPGETNREQVIVVRGGAGAGKTTFIRTYFRLLLPYLDRTNLATRIPAGLTPSPGELERHVLLYADVRQLDGTKDEVWADIYSQIAAQLRHRFSSAGTMELGDDIATHDNYAMWGHLYDTGNERWPDDDDVNRGEIVSSRWLHKEDVYAKAAVRYLSRIRAGKERRYFVSLVIDNVDQLSTRTTVEFMKSVNLHVNKQVRSHESPFTPVSTPDSQFWRVVLPMRPETLQLSGGKWKPFLNTRDLVLPAIDFRSVVSRRRERIVRIYSASGKSVGENMMIGDYKMPFWRHFMPEESGELMADIFTVDFAQFPEFERLLLGLCGDSTRKMLGFRQRISQSELAHQRLHMLRKKTSYKYILSPFDAIDAVMMAEIHDRTCDSSGQEEHIICNIFAIPGVKDHDYGALVVGMHSLSDLRNGATDVKTVFERLRKVGHLSEHIEAVRKVFDGYGLIRRIGSDSNGRRIYEKDLAAIASQLGVSRNRAYLECAAMENSGKIFRSNVHSDFRERVSNTVAFLRKVVAGEREFIKEARAGSVARFADDLASNYCQQIVRVISDPSELKSYLVRNGTALNSVKECVDGFRRELRPSRSW